MCDPATLMAMVAGGAKAGGTFLSMMGQITEGMVTQKTSQMQSMISSANASLLEKSAEIADLGEGIAYARGGYNESKVRTAGTSTLGQQRNYYASNHMDPAYGSPLLHEALTAMQVQKDVELVRATARLEAADAVTRGASLRAQAITQTANAGIQTYKGDMAQTVSEIGAAATFLKGVSSFASPSSGTRD